MNILLSSYSCNPYHGSEDGIGWNWTLQLSKNFNNPNDKIYLLTKRANQKDTEKGIKEFGLNNVELVISDLPDKLNWYKEKNSAFHHIYYIVWQKLAYRWAKKSKIKFDIVHHVTMGDFRITGDMYKFKNPYTIFGPVGGGQSTPKSLKVYEYSPIMEKAREIINKSCAVSPIYKNKIKKFDAVYAINQETQQILSKALNTECNRLMELAVADEFKNLNIIRKTENNKIQIVFLGRLIEKKGLMLFLDVIRAMKCETDFEVKIYGDGPLKDKMNLYIKTNSLENKVQLCGCVEHALVTRIFQKADIFVMPSLRETSGNVLIEALAHKIPVAALNMSICSDLKKHNCGLFVDINQSKSKIISDFADNLCRLANDANLRKELGENGYRFVNTHLNWEDKFKTIYQNISK